LPGWSSNSRYAFLGALRSAAQLVSYEVSMGLILISLIICVGSLNLSRIVEFQEEVWFVLPFFPLFILFFVSGLAETNRPPFDLPEAEGELVAGYNVEYSAIPFALFFIGEYANIVLFSTLITLLFFGGWSDLGFISLISNLFFFSDSILAEDFFNIYFSFIYVIKICFVVFLFIWARAAFPRYRYDQLMQLGWKVFLPTSLFYVFLISILVYYIAI